VFEPSPIVQIRLQRAAANAPFAAALAVQTMSELKIARALNVLACASDDGKLDDETIEVLATFITRHRSAELAD
jgi:hypothetical protein